MAINTNADDYIVDVVGYVRSQSTPTESPSNWVIKSLKAQDSRIQTRGFRQAVADAIFKDAVEDYFEDGEYASRVVQRLERRYGRAKARRILYQRCDALYCWKYGDTKFLPDAFLVDCSKRTVVCYEVEDSHPLNLHTLVKYTDGWLTLDTIYWDLHLIAYDIYGHPRVIGLLEVRSLAGPLTKVQRRSPE